MISYIRGLLILGLVFYAAVVYSSGELALLCYAGIGFMVFALITICICRWGIKGSLEVPITLTAQGQPVKVILDKSRKGKKYTGRVVFVLCIENTGLKQKRVIKQSVSGDAKGAFQITLENAGNYEISIQRIRVYDLSGLFYLSKRCKETSNIVVLPDFYPVNIRLTEAVRNFVGDAEIYDTLRSGDDVSEILKLREFQDGDKLKNIHWKLSAKMDELMVRENSLPKACSTVLLLEGDTGEKQGLFRKRKSLDAYFRAAASLSFSMMDKECPHYVAWKSRRYQDIQRIRVDSEESFYEFLLYLLQDFDRDGKGSCLEQYQEKYSAEVLLHHLVLKPDLALYERDALISNLNKNDLEKSFAELELVL